ncbi:hypothetical protein ACIB24_10490 [Spongisporangium articulatum]|uniref:Uncharacterized protein n=1 Tax=Spongisporangium articulatum TaxID=3362603 RepID=A0ABW8AM77_9ACTN
MDQAWLLPSLLEVAAVLAVVVLVALLARIALTVLGMVNAPVAPVRVRTRDRAQGEHWAPDAPGRPQPRAPDCGPYFD